MSLLSIALFVVTLNLRPRRVTALPFNRRDDDSDSDSDSDSDDCDRACRRRRRAHPRLSRGAIAGIVIGIVLFLVLFFILLWLWRRRQREKKLREKTRRMLEDQQRNRLLLPVVPPKDKEGRRDLVIPACLTPSSPRSAGSPSSMRNLGHSSSRGQADNEPEFTSMANLGHTRSSRPAEEQSVTAVSGHSQLYGLGDNGTPVTSLPNLGHAQSHHSAGDRSLLSQATAGSILEERSTSPIPPLPNPHDRASSYAPSSFASIGTTTRSNSMATTSLLSGPSTRRASALYEDLSMYQKKLEVHDQEEAQTAREALADPPPQYGS
ncbi:hypothetical protein GLOTRDRAFT_137763 [Gloeophyllum trabeum ATCC 11539]|uniref:receptor protein-tyrosine kinase n=1 Tax=Gloeophyllum trabeum (strain ATCC 11539 / FP-39264 / Madison 617) TaxID=670483 RepID=S7QDM6_GLOTA|nr:uncharacterized protein GLOTRDRAFT_137763 [Gloeophyllum trabeum ATCC 11539]EPQ57432.1 hypothetical protein GLOTRDRAFT_137763 [Gloeophyllum trabeum ATCC 11539]